MAKLHRTVWHGARHGTTLWTTGVQPVQSTGKPAG